MNTTHTSEHPSEILGATVRHCAWLISVLVLSVLTACASSGDQVSGAMQVTIKPGDTANCDTSPCQVSLEMPPGSGTYEVTGNEIKIGDFPAGETVSLGNLWKSNAIKVVGANVPTAYVYIPSQP